jgi:hypothetical protein
LKRTIESSHKLNAHVTTEVLTKYWRTPYSVRPEDIPREVLGEGEGLRPRLLVRRGLVLERPPGVVAHGDEGRIEEEVCGQRSPKEEYCRLVLSKVRNLCAWLRARLVEFFAKGLGADEVEGKAMQEGRGQCCLKKNIGNLRHIVMAAAHVAFSDWGSGDSKLPRCRNQLVANTYWRSYNTKKSCF